MTDHTLQETPAEPTRRDLAVLVDERGHWQREAVEALGAEQWRAWIEARLCGRDPYFPYRRDEVPAGASNLLRELFRKLHDLDTQHAAEGLARYLESLDPQTHPGVVLRQALDLVRHVRARQQPARDYLRPILRGWIQDRLLLGRTVEDLETPESLHRSALFALVVLQKQGDEVDAEVWDQWLDDDRFAGAAFSGMALSASELPEGWIGRLLDAEAQAESAGRRLLLRHPLEALFVGTRDRTSVMRYVWEEVHRLGDPEATWERIRPLLDRVVVLPAYPMMQRRVTVLERKPVNRVQQPSGPWTADFPRKGVASGDGASVPVPELA